MLRCAAFCGPDADLASDKPSSQFLDLSKIQDEEYECEGILICLKWYMNILEERQANVPPL